MTLDIVPPSADATVNILILLHGLGDTNASFTQLGISRIPQARRNRNSQPPGKNLNLAETACISLQGPNPIPALFAASSAPAFHWGDDVLFDERKGQIELDAGFATSTQVLKDIVSVLTEKCGFPPRNILFLGFGQGAMAALSLCASSPFSSVEYGGVVSIGGALPASSEAKEGKSRTPVLVCGGSRSTSVTRSAVDRLKARFGDLEYVKWEKGEDSMPRNKEEMLPVMRFFARRLRSRVGVPEGAVEV